MLPFFNKRLLNSFSFVKKMNQSIKASIQRAKRVQENVLEQNYTIQMENKLKNKINVETSIDELEKQLAHEISKSLGRSETKVKFFIQKAQSKYKELSSLPHERRAKQVAEYNKLIDLCQKARWELMIHRQSCGFTIKNHELVHSLYPIPSKILE